MHYFYFASWAKAYNLFDDKWYVYQYIRTSKTYYQQGKKYDKKNQKETKKQNSLRQNLTLISDTLVNIIGSVLNSCFKFPLHCKRTSLTKKRNKNDKIPRSRIWSRTTDRNLLRSDALPTCHLGNLSKSKAQYQTYVLGVLRTANIKPRKISAIPQKEKTRLCNILQSSQLVRSNFVHFDLLLLMFFFKKHLSSFIF